MQTDDWEKCSDRFKIIQASEWQSLELLSLSPHSAFEPFSTGCIFRILNEAVIC